MKNSRGSNNNCVIIRWYRLMICFESQFTYHTILRTPKSSSNHLSTSLPLRPHRNLPKICRLNHFTTARCCRCFGRCAEFPTLFSFWAGALLPDHQFTYQHRRLFVLRLLRHHSYRTERYLPPWHPSRRLFPKARPLLLKAKPMKIRILYPATTPLANGTLLLLISAIYRNLLQFSFTTSGLPPNHWYYFPWHIWYRFKTSFNILRLVFRLFLTRLFTSSSTKHLKNRTFWHYGNDCANHSTWAGCEPFGRLSHAGNVTGFIYWRSARLEWCAHWRTEVPTRTHCYRRTGVTFWCGGTELVSDERASPTSTSVTSTSVKSTIPKSALSSPQDQTTEKFSPSRTKAKTVPTTQLEPAVNHLLNMEIDAIPSDSTTSKQAHTQGNFVTYLFTQAPNAAGRHGRMENCSVLQVLAPTLSSLPRRATLQSATVANG